MVQLFHVFVILGGSASEWHLLARSLLKIYNFASK